MSIHHDISLTLLFIFLVDQALGITPGGPGGTGEGTPGTPARPDSSTPSSTPPSPAISTKTMEQLAEFDSILGKYLRLVWQPSFV